VSTHSKARGVLAAWRDFCVRQARRDLLRAALVLQPVAIVAPISPVLDDLLSFHPGWVTRSLTTHDPRGDNADGFRPGLAVEGDHRIVFHARGEGRIARIWMTTFREDLERGDHELWIETDGHTVYRGSLRDFFEGRGGWSSPLVMGYAQSSGGLTSYVPFAWSRSAKIRMKGGLVYSQITYRQGPGSAAGPTPEALASFMTEDWTAALPAVEPRSALQAGAPLVLATGPATVSQVHVQLPAAHLKDLAVRIGDQPPVPASFFFGLASDGAEPDGGWTSFRSALHAAWAPATDGMGRLATRLPIPLSEGETLALEPLPGATVNRLSAGVLLAPARPAARLLAQYRDQHAPGRETSMPVFESDAPLQFVALIENLSGGRPGDRSYLEGDEIIRTDGMRFPLQIGTGTEDYFNGGWYFQDVHANPFSGQHRFVVHDPEDGWRRARFEHSLYRLHVADPIVSRSGMRFGFEAGPTGAYAPLRVRSLGLAYTFPDVRVLGERAIPLSGTHRMRAAVDAERSEPARELPIRAHRSKTRIGFACPSADTRALLLVRTYSQARAPQEAQVRLDGRDVGVFHEPYANAVRPMAEDALWIELLPDECQKGRHFLEIDARQSPAPFSESSYRLRFFAGPGAPEVTQGPLVQILDTASLPEGRHYVNDHSMVRMPDASWLLTGIFNREPYGAREERAFVRATASPSGPACWYEAAAPSFTVTPERVTLRAAPDEPWIWAPHVARDRDGSLVMIYHAGSKNEDRARFRLARSRDGVHWTREAGTLFEDICVARDPMLVRFGDLWSVYYTRCASKASRASGVAYRTSLDLVHWGPPAMALTLPAARHDSGHTESPFVFARKGWFYLTVTSYPTDWDATFLYRSRSPFAFPPRPLARLNAHAAEWVVEEEGAGAGRLFFTHAGAGQGGVWMGELSGL